MRGKKLWEVFVVMEIHLEKMGVAFGVVVEGYLVSYEELHLSSFGVLLFERMRSVD